MIAFLIVLALVFVVIHVLLLVGAHLARRTIERRAQKYAVVAAILYKHGFDFEAREAERVVRLHLALLAASVPEYADFVHASCERDRLHAHLDKKGIVLDVHAA